MKKDEMQTNFKQEKIRDPAHLRFLRTLICANCGTDRGLQAAHQRHGSHAGLGSKPDDSRCVSLCAKCHGAQHAMSEVQFWGGSMDKVVKLGSDLYDISGDRGAGVCLILKFLRTNWT